jgi:hypothetical protein
VQATKDLKLLSFGDEESESAGVTIPTRMKSAQDTKKKKDHSSSKKPEAELDHEKAKSSSSNSSEELILQNAKKKASQYNFDDEDEDEDEGLDDLVKGSDAAEKKKMMKEKGVDMHTSCSIYNMIYCNVV